MATNPGERLPNGNTDNGTNAFGTSGNQSHGDDLLRKFGITEDRSKIDRMPTVDGRRDVDPGFVRDGSRPVPMPTGRSASVEEEFKNLVVNGGNANLSGSGGNDNGTPATQMTLNAQLRSLVGDAKRTVMNRTRLFGIPGEQILRRDFEDAGKRFEQRQKDFVKRNPNAVAPQYRTEQPKADERNAQAQPKADERNAQAQTKATVGGLAAQNAGITMNRAGGRDVASFMRGNTRIELPKGFNLDDDEKVSAFVQDQNDMIDMMDDYSDDNEEVFG